MTAEKQKSKFKKIYNVASGVITALLFVFVLFIVIMVFVQKKDGGEIKIFGYSFYTVVTNSMESTIHVGDVILAKEPDGAQNLKKGDIITFTAPSGPVKGYNETHRIYSVEYSADGSVAYYKTAGDNKYGGDEVKVDDWQIPPENVKGVYVRTLNGFTGLYKFMATWYGYFIVIGIPIIVVAGLFIAGFIKDKTEYEKTKITEKAKADAEKNISVENLSEDEKKKLLEFYLNKIETESKASETDGDNLITNRSSDKLEQNQLNGNLMQNHSDDMPEHNYSEEISKNGKTCENKDK